MSDDVCAAPSSFTLKVRIVSPLGEPFANHAYRLRWGSSAPEGQLDAHGVLTEANLDGAATGGILMLGERDANGFNSKLVLPLQRHLPSVCLTADPEPDDYQKKLYDLGWRLCNLALIGHVNPLPYDDTYPLSNAQQENVKEAIRRYKFKNGFRVGDGTMWREPPSSFYGDDPVISDPLVTHIKKTHDG